MLHPPDSWIAQEERMLTSWLTGLDKLVSGLAPSWLLSLALVTVAAALLLIAYKGPAGLKATALAWTVAP